MKKFPLENGTTYIQNLDKHMSKNKIDKGKVAKKLHGLQKRMTRMNENEGHASAVSYTHLTLPTNREV